NFLVAYASFALWMAREYDQAIPELNKLVEADPKFALAHAYLGLNYEQQKEYGKAIAAFQKSLDLDDNNPEGESQLGHIYARAGKREEALKILAHLTELSKKRYISPYNIAVLHLGLGNTDLALDWFEKAKEDHSEWFAYLNVDPRLGPIRTHPRFT